MHKHLPRLITNLCSINPTPALSALAGWAKTARFRDAVSLARATPEADRQILASAIRDTMCCYPQTLYCAPELLYLRSKTLHWLDLPDPASVREPNGAQWRWQELRRQLAPREFDNEPGIVAGKIEVALLTARTSDGDPPEINDDWLAVLFRHLPPDDLLHISCRIVLPWPDAIEAAIVLRSAARTPDELVERPNAFLSDHAWNWACDAGRAFSHFADA